MRQVKRLACVRVARVIRKSQYKGISVRVFPRQTGMNLFLVHFQGALTDVLYNKRSYIYILYIL